MDIYLQPEARLGDGRNSGRFQTAKVGFRERRALAPVGGCRGPFRHRHLRNLAAISTGSPPLAAAPANATIQREFRSGPVGGQGLSSHSKMSTGIRK